MALAKACIQPLDEKGGFKGDPIYVLFNPPEYTIEKSNQFQSTVIPGLSSPITHFISGNAQALSMDLFFDTYETGEDVRKHTSKITGLLDIDSKFQAPPVCMFVWGELKFKSIIEKVSQKYTMFMDTGVPVRATLNVTFKEYKTLTEQLEETKKNDSNDIKIGTAQPEEQICQISQRELGDSSRWREIARVNKISNPRTIKPGTKLVIPSGM